MSEKTELWATASRFAIAAAIVYFAYQLTQISDHVPAVTQSVDQISVHIEPALIEVKQVREEIGEVRRLVPEILDEVAAVREQIPPLVAQVEAINAQIDPILQRVDKTVDVVDKTQQQIPQILSTTDNAIVALNETRDEVIPLVPPTLEEVRLTRESVDPTLDRVEILVDDTYAKALRALESAQKAGQEASEGAIKGFFTGLIKLPFQLAGTLASPIAKTIDADVARQLTEEDLELLLDAGNQAVASNRPDREYLWENPNTGNSGSVAIIRYFELQGNRCVDARVRINNRRKEIFDKLNEFCRNAEDQWVLASELSG